MPTIRRRFQVTETPEVERALDLAAQRWPGESRSALLAHVIRAGAETIAEAPIVASRRAAIRRSAEAYSDAFDAGYLETLRSDWPE